MGKQIYLIFLAVLLSNFALAQKASISGRVTEAGTKLPLPGAYVHLDGTKKGSSTDAYGNFTITGLKAGEYKIKLGYVGFDEYENEVTIERDQQITLNIALKTGSKRLSEVKVYGRLETETEAASRSNERNSDNLKNVISARAIEKSPDINAANVLQRVSGVTIQRNAGGDDAFAIVRGLEPRYNSTLVNGVKIASTSNKTRLVSLSVIPSDLLSRIEVDKTLTPEMEGDAIGGTVNLVFKDAADHRSLSATGAVGYSQIFIDRKFLDFYKSDIQKYSPSESHGPSYQAQPNDFSRSNLDFHNITAPPTETFTLSYADRFLKNKLGVVIGDSYQNLYYGFDTEGNTGNADPNDPDHRPRINDIYNRNISSRAVLNNLVAHLDYKINDRNRISLDNLVLYNHLEEASVTADTSITGGNGGRTGPGTGPVSITSQSTTTNQLVEHLKLYGNHAINKHFQLDWYGVFSDAFVRIPDQAQLNTNIAIAYDPQSGQFKKTPAYFDNINRTWSHNNDQDIDGAANLTYKTDLSASASLDIKAGGLYRHKTRYNYEDLYVLRPNATANGGKSEYTDIYSAQWNVYTPYGAGEFNLNNYNAYENVTAYFGEFKLVLPKLEVFGGVREEVTSQGFYVRQDPTNPSNVDKSYTDVLPSLSLKYKLNEKSNIRLAYFASIARPAYFELVPTVPPSTGGTAIEGNPGLKHTTSNNYDVRYEIFPGSDEQFFVGAYYKELTNPIEYAYIGNNSANTVYKPINSEMAKVAGIETAFLKYWGNFGVSGNYAYNYSDVNGLKVDRNNPSRDVLEHRPLTGASKHDLNLSFLYRNDKAKFNAQLAYQFLGKTLVGIYPDNGDDYYQQPLSFLAFSADKRISKHFTLFAKLNNLTNTHTTIILHNFTNGKEVTGATYLLGLRYSY